MNSRRQDMLVLLAWCLLLALAWGLWLWRLEASDLTFDEAATYFVAHRPLRDILGYLRGAVREHPPVYYLLIHGWMALAGTSEFSLRFFSVGAGLVALALTGWLARVSFRCGAKREGHGATQRSQPSSSGASQRSQPPSSGASQRSQPPSSGASQRSQPPSSGVSLGFLGLLPAILFVAVPGMAYCARDARMYSLGIAWSVLSAGLFLRDWLLPDEPDDMARGGSTGTRIFADERGSGQTDETDRADCKGSILPPPVHGGALASLVAVHLLALFTHYYLLLPVLVQPLVLLVTRRWRLFLAWCAAHSLLALAGLAWLGLAPGLQMTTGGLWRDGFLRNLSLTVPERFQVFRLLGKVLFSPVVQVRFTLLYWLLALAGGGVLLALWRRRRVGVWLALTLLLPLVLAFQVPHPPVERYLLFVVPILALALGFLATAPLRLQGHFPETPPGTGAESTGGTGAESAGRLQGRSWAWAWGAAGTLTLGLAYLLTSGGLERAITFDRSHYGRTLETVKAHARPGDCVLFYGPWQWIPFQYYDPGCLPPITTLPPQAPPRLKPAETEPVLEALLAGCERLWVLPVAVDDVDPDHFAEGWLRTHAHLAWDTEDLDLYLPPHSAGEQGRGGAREQGVIFGETPPRTGAESTETPPGTGAESTGRTGAESSGALLLEGVAWEPQEVAAGEPLLLTLRWSPLRRLENDVSLTLHLADDSGYAWAEAQRLPGAWAHPPSEWKPGEVITDYEGLMVPQGAPPGQYEVRLMVTDDVTGEALPAEEIADKYIRTADAPLQRGSLSQISKSANAGEYTGRQVELFTVQVGEPLYPPVLYGLPNPTMVAFCPPGGADTRIAENECLTLAGYEPGGLRFQQGYAVPLTLHWLVGSGASPEVRVRLQVSHRSWLAGRLTPIASQQIATPCTHGRNPQSGVPTGAIRNRMYSSALPLVLRAYPWSPPGALSARPGERLLTTHAALVLPPDAPTGPAQITLEVLGPDEGDWMTAVPLFTIAVDGRPVARRLPGGLTPIQADLGEQVGLRGYRVEGEPHPGGQLHLTYAWYARTRPTAIYAVFNHLVATDGTLVAQADGWPQGGRMLSIQWQKGEYIEDSYLLAIPADAPPGPYTLYVGLYNAANGERQAAFLDGQRLADDRLPIPIANSK